jgi:uncharacterized Fe-S radical SAM superfamily protein PflX
VDIYLPDMKYMDGQQAAKYSAGASDYPTETQKAVLEMHRQVGQHQAVTEMRLTCTMLILSLT